MHMFLWRETGIKIQIFRRNFVVSVSCLLTNARAALPVRTGFLKQPPSLAHFPPCFPNIPVSSRGGQCMLHRLYPRQISKALPAFCRAGRPENISFVQMQEQKCGSFAPLLAAVQRRAVMLAAYPASGHVLRGEKHLRLLLTSDGDRGCSPPTDISPKALGRNRKDITRLLRPGGTVHS